MKIWIDFINTPQVSFWIPFIDKFTNEGHEVLLTCRDSGNTVALLEQNKLSFQIIGQKAGKGLYEKVFLFIKRLKGLYSFIRKNKIDVAASQSSFYQAFIANLLNIPSLYTNDNEHAKGNFIAFRFATKIYLPIMLKEQKITNKRNIIEKINFYPSVKEAIYLSQNKRIKNDISSTKNKIYFRPEPWSAQYYDGPLNFFDEILIQLSEKYEVVVLPRDMNQTKHYCNDNKFKTLKVEKKPLSLGDILSNCMLFIGAGGSMTRELAVLGIPVISIYQAELLAVDRYLEEKGCMIIKPSITFLEIEELLLKVRPAVLVSSILNDGENSFELLYNEIIKLKQEC